VDGREQPRYTIHQLRHTLGSNLIRELPEQIVSRVLGHRDPRSTRRYAEVNEEQVRVALAERDSTELDMTVYWTYELHKRSSQVGMALDRWLLWI
jgi:hypothetical protein